MVVSGSCNRPQEPFITPASAPKLPTREVQFPTDSIGEVFIRLQSEDPWTTSIRGRRQALDIPADADTALPKSADGLRGRKVGYLPLDGWIHHADAAGLVTIPEGYEAALIISMTPPADTTPLADHWQAMEFRDHQLRDADWAWLQNQKQLHSLLLQNATFHAADLALLDEMPRIRALTIHRCTINGDWDDTLQKCISLEALKFEHTWINDALCEQIAQLPRLRVLSLEGAALSDTGLQALCRQDSPLEILLLDENDLTDEGTPHLANLQKLQTLSLHQNNLGADSWVRIGQLPQLRQLALDQLPVTALELVQVTVAPQLRELYISGTEVDDAALVALAKCPQLEVLALAQTSITDKGLAHLQHCPQLQRLDLAGTAVTDVGLMQLIKCPQLRNLNLSFTALTDDGLQTLAQLKNLQSLNLAGTQLRGPGLSHLRQLHELRFLELFHCAMNGNPESMRYFHELQAALPDCYLRPPGN
ncbi:MAG: hypothetical protein HJJLKODD_01873 [Phycisphaerae bacterium]|nr:hypothetical protein [Phycisphaerae bacterium]